MSDGTWLSACRESYREELDSRWGIRPAWSPDDVESRLDDRERKFWHQHLRRTNRDARAEKRFYDWLSNERRVGAIHSFKWAEILVSGTFAAVALRRLGSQQVLDLGCNVGYWSTWASQLREVHGIDRSRPAIEMAKRRAAGLGRRATFAQGDFIADDGTARPQFQCVVSLQALSCEIADRNFTAIEHAARYVQPGGHLIMVEADRLGEGVAADVEAAIHRAGLSAIWVANCGGIGFGGASFNYLGLIARKDGEGEGTIASYFDPRWWDRFCDWADAIPVSESYRANSAYYCAEHPSELIRAAVTESAQHSG